MPLPVNGNTLVMRDADVQTCAEVAQELMANPTLTDVRLRGSDIGDKGCASVCTALEQNKT
eukprot:CAMPEP_0174284390 /NCGR_PEP_ID=MMETSP0809-20121228/5290_1 /TAXON_ID=73025 ORGANISM="Eutreptiella gymnastica-like, Strain CCMP1594" /NCGR_SAMPLE_ID=MMETSP0809 /ASSEMBLY_ACC=CAM_ASM_000658 /LENGTH=60 /DNA_ID=CAMNT_0015379877 /DNA_START=18 /DNA_END=196 /DNA_ORIENTATION=-